MVGLLIVEVSLFLARWLRWFPFDRHKGWAVLIAAATVVAVLSLALLWFLAALLFRFSFQFTVGSLFLLTLVVAILSVWIAGHTRLASRQRAAVEAIAEAGGHVRYDYEIGDSGELITSVHSPEPVWLRRMLGDDFFDSVVSACLQNDDAIKHVNELLELRTLVLGNVLEDTNVTDDGLEHLDSLPQLRDLYLDRSRVTDSGLEHLGVLKGLEGLSLRQTAVTDRGLERLRPLSRLRALAVGRTRITDAGLRQLSAWPDLRGLDLSDTRITDAGVKHLYQLRCLQRLNLSGTQITDAGLDGIENLTQLEWLSLRGTRVTSAAVGRLMRLSSLRELDLHSTRVTEGSQARLRRALPNCAIVPPSGSTSSTANK